MIFQIRWRRPLHQLGEPTAVAVAPDRVVVHERGTRLVCLNATDGVVQWDVPFGTWPRAVVVEGDQCWAIPQNRDELYWLDVHTGALVRSTRLPPFTGHVVVTGDTVLVGGWRGYTRLHAFDRYSGITRWTSAQRVHTVLPGAVGSHVLIGQPGGRSVQLIDPRDGNEIFRWVLPEPLIGADGQWDAFTPAGEDRFLVRCGQHTVWQIHARSGEADEFFRSDTELAADGMSVTDGVVWVRESRAGHVAVDAATGSTLWRVDVGYPTVGDVVAAGRGFFVVAGQPGMVLLIDSTGTIRERITVDRRNAALRGLAPNTVLVIGKGTLTAVAAGSGPVSNAAVSGSSLDG